MIGDFLLQTEWMASNKRSSNLACGVHVLVYLLPFLLTDLAGWQILLIGIPHFIQDRIGFGHWWVTTYKRMPAENQRYVPFLVDQSLHLLSIELVLLAANVSF
jgi:hypothetical protein